MADGRRGGLARSRNIKPGFFLNDELAEIEPLGRLLFIGLWTLADRAGRLEDRPKKIKAAILPYDNCNIDKLLQSLYGKGFIIRYLVSGDGYIQVVNFTKHQNPHMKEQASEIPAPDLHHASTVLAPDEHGSRPAESLLLNPESLLLNTAAPCKTRAAPPPKIKYLDAVYLTDVEYQKLQEVLGQKNLDIGIEQLDYSITVKSGKYKDHYKTLLNWQKRGYLNGENGGGQGKYQGVVDWAERKKQEMIQHESQ